MLYDYKQNNTIFSLDLFEDFKSIWAANKTNQNIMTSFVDGEKNISNEIKYSNILSEAESSLNAFYKNLNSYIENVNGKNIRNRNKYLNLMISNYSDYENKLKEINTNEIFLASDEKFENKFNLRILNAQLDNNLNIKSFMDDINMTINNGKKKTNDIQNKIRGIFNDYKIFSIDENNLLVNNLTLAPANKDVLRTEIVINNPDTYKVLTENSYSFFRDFSLTHMTKDNQFKESKKIETIKTVIKQFNFLDNNFLEEEDFKTKFKQLESTSYNEMNAVILEDKDSIKTLINEHPEKLKMTFNYLLRHHDTTNLKEFLTTIKNIDNNGIYINKLKEQLDGLSPISYILKEFSKEYENGTEEELELGKKRLGEICGEYENNYEQIISHDITKLLKNDHINPRLFGDVLKHLNWDELTAKDGLNPSLAEHIISCSVGKESLNFDSDSINLLKNLVEHPEFDMSKEFFIQTSKHSKNIQPVEGYFTLPDYLKKAKDALKIQMMDTSNNEEMQNFINDGNKQEVINTIQDASKLGGKTGQFAKDLIKARQNVINFNDKFHLTWIEKTFCTFIALFHSLEVAVCKRHEKKLVKEIIQKTLDKDGNRILSNAKIKYDEKTGNVLVDVIYKNSRTSWENVGTIDPKGIFSDVRLSKEHQEEFKLQNEDMQKLSSDLSGLNQNKESFISNLNMYVNKITNKKLGLSEEITNNPKKGFKKTNNKDYEIGN